MFDFSEYGFTEESSLEANEWIDHTEWLDFVACMRSDGSVYGTGGRCRQGREVSLKPGEGMPKVAGKARAAGMKQARVKEIADAVRAKFGGKQVRGDALASVVRRINEDLKKGGGSKEEAAKELARRWKEFQKAQKEKSAKREEKKEGLDAALKKAEAEASKVKSSGAGKGLTADVGRKFPRKGDNELKHPEDKERDRGRLDARFLGKMNVRQLKRLQNEASLNEGQKKRIRDELAKRGAKPSGGGSDAAKNVKFEKQPGGGVRALDGDGKVIGYINKGGIGYRAYNGKGEHINNFRNITDAKNGIKNRNLDEVRKAAKEDKELAAAPKNVKEMAKAYREGKTLGKGAMGEVRRNDGPPPTIIKKGEIGENEAAALKRLEGTGVAPKLIADTSLNDVKQVKPGLGGHVTAGKGMLQMSEAKGQPGLSIYGETSQGKIERLNSLMEARAKMHMAGVAHNDMHSGNVFYDKDTKKSTIVDFGLSQIGYKFALAEALGTNRGDYQSGNHFDSDKARENSEKYARFEMNRNKVLKKIGVPSDGTIRRRAEELPLWLRNMSESDAEKLVQDLYKGV